MNPRIGSLSVGDRFIVKPAYPDHGDPRVLTVTAKEAREVRGFTAADADGVAFKVDGNGVATGPDGKPRCHVVWTLALPDLPDDQAIAYTRILQGSRDSQPWFFHVVSVGNDVAVAHLVSTRYSAISDEIVGVPGFTARTVGHVDIMEQPVELDLKTLPPAVAQGDLLLTFRMSNTVVDGRQVSALMDSGLGPMSEEFGTLVPGLQQVAPLSDEELAKPHVPRRGGGIVVARGLSETDLGRFLPAPGSPELNWFGHSARTFSTACWVDYAHETVLAEARTQPDEALVLFASEGGDHPRDAFPHLIGTSGYTFAIGDSHQDYMEGECAPGLWVLKEAKWWGYRSCEGEYDSGIDGQWVPATPADLETFGFDTDSIETELAEHLGDYGIDPTPGISLASEWMSKADRAHKEELAAEEAARIARDGTRSPSP